MPAHSVRKYEGTNVPPDQLITKFEIREWSIRNSQSEMSDHSAFCRYLRTLVPLYALVQSLGSRLSAPGSRAHSAFRIEIVPSYIRTPLAI